MRSWQEIDAAKTEADIQDLQTSVQGYPPGFVEGGELTLNDSAQVEVAPIAIQVGSRNVKINETVIINEEHWNIGGQTVNRLATKWYDIYISELGTFHVSHLEATFDPDLYGYYHPTIARHRGIGRFYIDANSVITRVAHLGPHRLTITDDLDRYIEISADAGLYAEDANGVVIHDIPDAPILSDMIYGGHIIWKDAPAIIASYDDGYNDNATTGGSTSATTNTDLSAVIANLTNAKGTLVYIYGTIGLANAKGAAGAFANIVMKYSTAYNTAPATRNYILEHSLRVETALTADHTITFGQQASLPIVYNGTTPYLTWNATSYFSGMAAAVGIYRVTADIYILGVYV